MATQKTIEITQQDVESLGQKLEQLHEQLGSRERVLFEMLMSHVGTDANIEAHARGGIVLQFPPLKSPIHLLHPRGGGQLIIGGNDGLTIIVKPNGHIVIIPPEGPGDPGGFVAG